MFKRLRSFTLYRRIFLSTLLAISLCVGIISVSLYAAFSHTALENARKHAGALLAQTGFVSYYMESQLLGAGRVLASDAGIYSLLYDETIDRVREYSSRSMLLSFLSTYSFHSIGIYNAATDRYFGTDTISAGKPEDTPAWWGSRSEDGVYQFAPSGAGGARTLDFYYRPIRPDGEGGASFIVIRIESDFLYDLVRAIPGPSNQSFCVVDARGVVLAHSEAARFMENLSEDPVICRIREDGGESGAFITPRSDGRRFVTWVRTENPRWYYVSIQSYNEIVKDNHALLLWALGLSLTLLAGAALLAVLLSNRIYGPIEALLERVRVLSKRDPHLEDGRVQEVRYLDDAYACAVEEMLSAQAGFSQIQSFLKNAYLRLALEGEKSRLVLPDEWSDMAPGEKYRYFAVIVFEMEGQAGIPEPVGTSGAAFFALSGMAEELLSPFGAAECCRMFDSRLCVLCCLEKNAIPEDLKRAAVELHTRLKHLGFLSAGCLGPVVTGWRHVHESYRRALDLIVAAYLRAGDEMFDATALPAVPREMKYPVSAEKRLSRAVSERDRAAAAAAVEEFVGAVRACSEELRLSFIRQIMQTLAAKYAPVAQSAGRGMQWLFEDVGRAPEALADFGRQALTDFTEKLLALAEQAHSAKNRQVVEQALEYVKRDYQNPQICLEFMAGRVGLSASYFGKVFKASTGRAFNDFVTETRMENALRLLTQTSRPIRDIAAEVGYCNTNYFFTVFKRHYGATPTYFRNSQKIED